jgi:hypothetical protein
MKEKKKINRGKNEQLELKDKGHFLNPRICEINAKLVKKVEQKLLRRCFIKLFYRRQQRQDMEELARGRVGQEGQRGPGRGRKMPTFCGGRDGGWRITNETPWSERLCGSCAGA